ncbi:MAG: hypothetical protein V1720_04195 [bacterium]
MNILSQISEKGSDKEKIANKVIKNPELLPEVFEGLNYPKADTKYGCEKVLRLISESKPEILYPYFDRFVEMMNSDVTFHKWGAIISIANLASVDTENKIDRLFKKYFSPIDGTTMITAANIIGSAYKIALAKPELADKIAKEILKVEYAIYETDECRNIAIGHAIESFTNFYELIKNKKQVNKFILEQMNNSRTAVKKKAGKFLKKYKMEEE